MKFGEFTALLSSSTETIGVKIEDEPGYYSSINPFGAISAALQDYEILEISAGDEVIHLTLKKGAGE